MVLQHTMDFIKAEPDPVSETCLSSYYENQLIDVKEENEPGLISCPTIKAETEVSCNVL
jgi:hypothetical protein